MYGNYRPGEYIVVDLKHMPKSIHGDEYLCVFTCLSTRLSESVYLKTRLASEFLDHYKNYCKHIRNKIGNYPKFLHSDNGMLAYTLPPQPKLRVHCFSLHR